MRRFYLSCWDAALAGIRWDCCGSCHSEIDEGYSSGSGPSFSTKNNDYEAAFCCCYDETITDRQYAARILWATKKWRN